MPAYLIGYDLDKPGQDYSNLFEAIKGIANGWWHHLDSTWLIRHVGPASFIRDTLRPHIDANDELLVVTLSGEWASSNLSEPANDWLRSYVSQTAPAT